MSERIERACQLFPGTNPESASRTTLQEITAEWRGERQRWGDTVLGSARELRGPNGEAQQSLPTIGGGDLTVKGQAPLSEDGKCELERGLSYRFYGRFTEHPKYGRQFHFQTFVRAQPHSREGIIRYLQKAPNIGQAFALKLWQKFAGDAVRILRESPEVAAAAVDGLSADQAREAAEWLSGEVALESCSIDLIDLLAGRGFPRNTAKAAVAKWGNRAPEIIRRNPYALMRFRGCGFARTDAMYLDLGLPPERLKRQAYCCWYVLSRDTDGHTWRPVEFVEEGLRGFVGGADVNGPAALKLAKLGGLIATRRDESGRLWIAERRRAEAEASVAGYASKALAEGGGPWIDMDELAGGLSDHQRQELTRATVGRIGLLNGSPGTGKTFTVAALVKVLVDRFGGDSVAICCPTGKAAVRASEAMASYGVPLRAATIHSTLGVAQADQGEGWSFAHDENNPLPFRFIVVDESSMIDAPLMSSLLAARAPGARLLLVGDTGQLPPVGHGAPLRDFIAAGLPRGELTEIRRNAGTIVQACAAIRSGTSWQPDQVVELPEKNLKLVEASAAPEQIRKVLACLGAARADGLDPVWDCQVLAAVNAKSQVSRKELNRVLQAELNPSGTRAGGNPFRAGDKIVNTKNGFLPLADDFVPPPDAVQSEDGKVFVANGELALVLSAEDRITIAELSSPWRVVKIPRGVEADGGSNGGGNGGNASEESTGTGCNWELGYCLSTHKSQGSEWPLVVVVLDEYPGARMVCSREWMYTAISRAKKLCFLVGKLETARGYCRRLALDKRKTLLVELIREEGEGRALEAAGELDGTDDATELAGRPETCAPAF